MGALVLLAVLAFLILVNAHERARRRKMIRQAYNFAPANTLGGARLGANDDLRKAGLFK
jgi:hypothetical protein